jgi:threonine/homoserine/homoserine lactone efflux protein
MQKNAHKKDLVYFNKAAGSSLILLSIAYIEVTNGSVMISAFLSGLLMSCIGSMPPTGPIAIIVLKHGFRGEKLSAMAIASGAALAEAGYALLAYIGINYTLSRYPVQASIMQLLAATLLVGFAIHSLAARSHPKPQKTFIQHTGGKFLLGLGIAGLNPTFLATWAGAVTTARGLGLTSEVEAAPAFAVGVILGPIIWFWILLRIVSRKAENVHPKILGRIEKALPIVLLILATVIIVQALRPLLH